MSLKRVLIVDDEKLARSRVIRFLSELNLPCRIEQAENGFHALELIAEFAPEIIFLDVQMPGMDGFEVLRQIEHRSFQVIFATAFDEFALNAFEEDACDYLLKPFALDRFEKAIRKAWSGHDSSSNLEKLDQRLKKEKGWLDKLTIRQGGKIKIVDLRDAICFISRDHCTCLHTKTSELIVDHSLSWLEERLDPDTFLRCHRNNIVAIDQIRSIGGSNDSTVELSNGMSLPLSRSNRSAVLERFSSIKS